MKVSLVVPTYNRRELLLRGLSALREQTRPPDELIVVDNASGDGSAEAVRAQFPEARLIVVPPPNRGACFAFNSGLASAAGDILLMVDDDALAAPDLVQRVAERFTARPDLGLLACRAIDPTSGRATALWAAADARPAADGTLPCASFDGAGVALRRAVLAQTGLFWERLFIYYNEPELTARVLLAGLDARYDPACVVYHRTGARRGGFYLARNALWFAWMYLPAGWALRMSLLMPLAALRRGARNGTLLPTLRGLAAAPLGLPEVLRRRRPLPAALLPRYLPFLESYGAELRRIRRQAAGNGQQSARP